MVNLSFLLCFFIALIFTSTAHADWIILPYGNIQSPSSPPATNATPQSPTPSPPADSTSSPSPSPVTPPEPSPPVEAPLPTQGNPCDALVFDMIDCQSFIEKTSNQSVPTNECCKGFTTVLKKDFQCVCYAMDQATKLLGIKINYTKAGSLPQLCHVSAPPITACNITLPPTTSPSQPSPSPSQPFPSPPSPSTPAPINDDSQYNVSPALAPCSSSTATFIVPVSIFSFSLIILSSFFI